MIEFINNNPFLYKSLFLIFAGFAIRYALIISGQRWANTYHHLGTYVLLPIISLVISTIIKDDIALSLGMIGALSIVRFRNPVKSPFELVIFFALVTIGISAGVDINLCKKLFILIVIIILGIKIFDKLLKRFLAFNLFNYSFGDGNVNFSIDIEASEDINYINYHKGLISSFVDKKNNIYHYRIVFNNQAELNKFKEQISDNKNINSIRADLQS